MVARRTSSVSQGLVNSANNTMPSAGGRHRRSSSILDLSGHGKQAQLRSLQRPSPQKTVRRSNSMPTLDVAKVTAASKQARRQRAASPASTASLSSSERSGLLSYTKSAMKSPGKSSGRSKSVRFQKEEYHTLYPTQLRKDIPNHERLKMWYTKFELMRMKTAAESAAKNLTPATTPTKQNLDRGLEPLDTLQIANSRSAVMMKQRRRKSGDKTATPAAIATLYKSKCTTTLQTSLQRAKEDAQEARAYQKERASMVVKGSPKRQSFSFRRK